LAVLVLLATVLAAALVLVDVMMIVVAPPAFVASECSDCPKSLPQFEVYHVMTCWLSLGFVHTESQMPVGEVYRLLRYPD